MSIIRDTVVITRKECQCFGCARLFPKGTSIRKTVWVDGRHISTNPWCAVCTEYWSLYMDYGDEIGIGELKSNDPEGWEELRKEIEDGPPALWPTASPLS